MCVKFRVKETDKLCGFEHARCIGFFTGWINFILMKHWELTLDVPESHHYARTVFFFSRMKDFGEHSAAAAANSA